MIRSLQIVLGERPAPPEAGAPSPLPRVVVLIEETPGELDGLVGFAWTPSEAIPVMGFVWTPCTPIPIPTPWVYGPAAPGPPDTAAPAPEAAPPAGAAPSWRERPPLL